MTMLQLAAKRHYFRLVRKFPLRPIANDEQLDRAIEVLNPLLLREDLTQDEQGYVDVLSDLIEKYEDVAIPEGPVSDADILAHLIEAKGVTQHKVALATGIAESTISSLLKGRRRLNRKHLVTLAAYFHVSPDVFLSHEMHPRRRAPRGGREVRPPAHLPRRRQGKP